MTAFLAFLRLVPLKDWLYIGGASVLLIAVEGWDLHERAVGRAQCEAKVTAAEAAAKATADRLQSKLDHDAAAQDATLQAALHAVPSIMPSIRLAPGCKLTEAQVGELRKVLQ